MQLNHSVVSGGCNLRDRSGSWSGNHGGVKYSAYCIENKLTAKLSMLGVPDSPLGHIASTTKFTQCIQLLHNLIATIRGLCSSKLSLLRLSLSSTKSLLLFEAIVSGNFYLAASATCPGLAIAAPKSLHCDYLVE